MLSVASLACPGPTKTHIAQVGSKGDASEFWPLVTVVTGKDVEKVLAEKSSFASLLFLSNILTFITATDFTAFAPPRGQNLRLAESSGLHR